MSMKKRLLILSHDNKIGDAIVATGLLHPLSAHTTGWEIGVLCGPTNAALYLNHPNVRWVHISRSRNVFARIWASLKARRVQYDSVVHFGLDVDNFSDNLMFWLIKAKQRYLFAKNPVNPLPNDIIVNGLSDGSHYSKRHELLLKTLGIPISTYQYDIRLKEINVNYRRNKTLSMLVINSQGSAADRSLSLSWLQELISMVLEQCTTTEILLLSASRDHEKELKKEFLGLSNRVSVSPFHSSVSHALMIIRDADVVLTPDTYAVQAASAWNIPVIALYAPNGQAQLWAPLSDKRVQIEASSEKTVNDIDVSVVVQALREVM